MSKVNVYAIHEFRPEAGTYDFYSIQSTLEEAVGWYAKQKGLQLPLSSDVYENDEGQMTWIVDRHSGGSAMITRYQVPVVETVEDDD